MKISNFYLSFVRITISPYWFIVTRAKISTDLRDKHASLPTKIFGVDDSVDSVSVSVTELSSVVVVVVASVVSVSANEVSSVAASAST